MKISQKKTCRRCKALYNSGSGLYECKLGYIIETINNKDYGYINHINPSIPCPKPKNFKELNISINFFKKNK